MSNSLTNIILDIMSNDAIAAVILITLLAVWWLSWKFVIKPLMDMVKEISDKIDNYFNTDDIDIIKADIECIKNNQLNDDIDFIMNFIKTNTNLIETIKEIDKNSSNIILTKENLNEINQDLIYIRRYIDKNFDNHKKLTEISEEIKKVVRYIENNRNNIDGKYMETALKVILEGLGSQTRTRFDNNN